MASICGTSSMLCFEEKPSGNSEDADSELTQFFSWIKVKLHLILKEVLFTSCLWNVLNFILRRKTKM